MSSTYGVKTKQGLIDDRQIGRLGAAVDAVIEFAKLASGPSCRGLKLSLSHEVIDVSDYRNGEYRQIVEMVVVLAPIPIAILLAQATGTDALAVVGVPVSLFLAWGAIRRRKSNWTELGLRRPASLPRTIAVAMLWTVSLLILTSLIGSLLARMTGLAPEISKFDILRGNVPALVAGLLLVWSTAAFGEELLFRGYLINRILALCNWAPGNERRAWGLALLVSSAAFGLGHAYQGAAGVILTASIGLGLGLIYRSAGRNLWTVILTHGLYDTAGFLIIFFDLDKATTAAALLGSQTA
jgi:membrane protease YdiL (CAAX protease family)